jgi:3-dehydroquinate synthetase
MLQKHNVTFPVFESLKISKKKNTVCITDENVFEHYKRIFKDIDTIVLKSGEEYKTQETINTIIGQLIDFKTDKTTTLIGVGGGVVTDITGYVASVYMRGIKFGFVPTTLLAMVDASLGGKNGVNFGLHKNFIGTLNQPQFIKTEAVYGEFDAFYEANGNYHLFHTCNTWANNGLKAAHQKAAIWTPFESGIFYHYLNK